MRHAQSTAGRLKAVGREARAAIREHVGDLEREGAQGLFQEGRGATLGLVILDR